MVFAFVVRAGSHVGDGITARMGDRSTLFWGGTLAIAGCVLLLTAPLAAVAMAGFLLIGLGASNNVPVLFRNAGSQKRMPSPLAVGPIPPPAYSAPLPQPSPSAIAPHP